MSRSELILRLAIELFLVLLLFSLLVQFLGSFVALTLALLGAHTINWLLNCHFWALMKNFDLVRTSEHQLLAYAQELAHDMKGKETVKLGAVYGSLVRGEAGSNSDLDVRIIHADGIKNTISAYAFLVRQRMKAFVKRFPLDIVMFDSVGDLRKMRTDEVPLILKDEKGELKGKRLTLISDS